MPQYLYLIQCTRPAMLTEGPTEREARIMGDHFAYLERLTAEGTMILVGRTQNRDPSAMGIAVFRAASDEAAEAIMRVDPAVSEGVMDATLFPYKVALISEANARREG